MKRNGSVLFRVLRPCCFSGFIPTPPEALPQSWSSPYALENAVFKHGEHPFFLACASISAPVPLNDDVADSRRHFKHFAYTDTALKAVGNLLHQDGDDKTGLFPTHCPEKLLFPP